MIDREQRWYSPVEIHSTAERLVDEPTSDESGSSKAEFYIHRKDPENPTAVDWACKIATTMHTYRFDSDTTHAMIHFKNCFGNQIIFCQDDGNTYNFNQDNVEIEFGTRSMFSPD